MKMQAKAAAAAKEKAALKHAMLPLPLARIINYPLPTGAWTADMTNMGPDAAGATA